MKVIKAGYTIDNPEIFDGMIKRIEKAGRTCYKSDSKIADNKADDFVRAIIKRGHTSVIEHGGLISVRFIVDRGISHEIVRHRIASFAQESTRYCNYTKDRFGGDLTFIEPLFWTPGSLPFKAWVIQCQRAEETYNYLISLGATPQEARSVLPNSLKAELVMTANPREWRSFFELRCSDGAHPQIREVAKPLLKDFIHRAPALFEDLAALTE